VNNAPSPVDPFVAEYLLGHARSTILRNFLECPAMSLSVHDMRSRSGVSEIAVRRELKALTELGLLTSSRAAPRRYKVADGHPAMQGLIQLLR
jgi:predicted ArsR family transcriptional regulator